MTPGDPRVLLACFVALVIVGALGALATWFAYQDRMVVEEATRVLPVDRHQEPPR